MKGYRLNKDIEYVKKIMQGIERKNGHCPCRLKEDDTTLCPCDEFIKKVYVNVNYLYLLMIKESLKPLFYTYTFYP